MVLRFLREMYPKSALIKAAYHFTPEAYVHLDADETHYLVELIGKTDKPIDWQNEFKEELLAQTVRIQISNETMHLRELLMARAFASTIVEEAEQAEAAEKEDFALEDILRDWFESHDEEAVH